MARQRESARSTSGRPRQLAAIQGDLPGGGHGAGGSSIDDYCKLPQDKSPDGNLNVGDPCARETARSVPLSFDPNDKAGPLGVGPDHRVPADEPIPYTVHFENLGPGCKGRDGNPYPTVATVPAQRVSVSDPLSADLDWDTFRFTGFGFGDQVIDVPDGLNAFSTTVPVTQDGVTFEVRIDAGIGLGSSLVFVNFQSLDPVMGLPPHPLLGMLPPEDGTGRGTGYFRFEVKPKAGLAAATQIHNVARIRFDHNEVIATNQVSPLDPAAGTDPSREALVTVGLLPPAVAGRYAFYNNSLYDGHNPAANRADDAAIAPGKAALLPTQAPTAANVTNYSRGINGVMIDLASVPGMHELAASDVLFDVGGAGGQWTPVEFTPGVAVRLADGADDSDRVTFTFPDGAVRNMWLRVTILANGHTGLSSTDVFYFGNLVGDTGNDRGMPTVNASDLALTRAAVFKTDAASLNRFDFNHDGRIDAADVLIVRNNQRRALPPFTAPAAAAIPAAADTVPVRSHRTTPRPPRRGVLEADFGLLA